MTSFGPTEQLAFQRARLRGFPKVAERWNAALEQCAPSLKAMGVDPQVITEWADLETCRGLAALHYNVFNLPPASHSPYNVLVVLQTGKVGEGGLKGARTKVQKFGSLEEGIMEGARRLVRSQRDL